ncbi:hypothetical protein Tco_0494917 [Tanacetum coccineum]
MITTPRVLAILHCNDYVLCLGSCKTCCVYNDRISDEYIVDEGHNVNADGISGLYAAAKHAQSNFVEALHVFVYHGVLLLSSVALRIARSMT